MILLTTKQAVFTKNVALLLNFLCGQGYEVSLGECWRSPETAHTYAIEHKGIEHSLHCKRLAIDINLHDKDGKYLTDSKYYEVAGKYWQSLHVHNRWGGFFKSGCCKVDCSHFEMQDL